MAKSLQDAPAEKLEVLYSRWSERIKRGFLRMIVLKIFSTQNSDGSFPAYSGTSMIEHIKNQTNDNWEPSYGSMYPIFNEMEEEETIELVNTENRVKEFRITNLGINLFDKIVEDSILFRSNFNDLNNNEGAHYKNHLKGLYRNVPIERMKMLQKRFMTMSQLLQELIDEKEKEAKKL